MATKRKSRKSGGTDVASLGRWAFLGGLVLSIVAGLAFAMPTGPDLSWQRWVVYLLIVLGLVGGYLHVGRDSEKRFLLIALTVYFFSDRLGYVPSIGNYLTSILGVVGVFLSLAALAVVVRNFVDWFRS